VPRVAKESSWTGRVKKEEGGSPNVKENQKRKGRFSSTIHPGEFKMAE
jgi:hypothetical protein